MIVDKCHVDLDSRRSFRPQSQEVSKVVKSWVVQMICLTGNALTGEATFCKSVALIAGGFDYSSNEPQQ